MTAEQGVTMMFSMILLTMAGMGCLFFWWLLNNKGRVEQAKHDMLRGETGPDFENDSEVYL